MNVTFRAHDHTYWNEGKQLPSVSEVIGDISRHQYAGVDAVRMEAAAIRGNKVDRIVQDAVMGAFDPDDHDFDLLPYYDAWMKFVATSGFQVTGCQTLVSSESRGYAGQLDLSGRFPKSKRECIVDVKNTFAVMPSARVQTAGYAMALAEMHGEPPAFQAKLFDRYVLHFKNDACTLKPLQQEVDYRVFLAALTVNQFKRGML